MKICIDESVCLKHHLTMDEVVLILAVNGVKDLAVNLDNLINRGILRYNEKYTVHPKWQEAIDKILLDSAGGIDDEQRLNNLAQEMRKCFPEGRMPGTSYYYRCNAREIIMKLKKFFINYGNYPDDRIIDATKRFVASFQGNYKYLPLLKYFISKNKTVTDENGVNHITEVSPLADYLENKEEGNVITANDDWLTTVRN